MEGFHPVRGCVKRLEEHQQLIDTDFQKLRSDFANNCSDIPRIDELLASIIEAAPARLNQLRQQLADCLYWELQTHGQHVCAGYEVSEPTIRSLYALVSIPEEVI